MRRGPVLGVAALIALIAAVAALQVLRPPPAAREVVALPSTYVVPGSPLALPYPATGQAALYLEGTGWVGQTPGETSVAIASVTKLMTALLVVRAHPLAPGSSGPTLVISGRDVALYQADQASGDSVLPVTVGEDISEEQLLEGLLLPSGDNIAVLLAQWVSGSEAAFVQAMNEEARRLGMTNTVYADASGLNPGSVSTAADLTRLAIQVMDNPALAAIVAMPDAVLPVAGTVHNYDFVLGQQGVVGLKTGWTEVAGGCFVFAAKREVGGRMAELVGAVLAQPGNAYTGIEAAEDESVGILAATWAHLRTIIVVPRHAKVGEVLTKWGETSAIVTKSSISELGWPGLRLRLTLTRGHLPIDPAKGALVGRLTVASPGGGALTTRVQTLSRVPGPSFGWKLLDTYL